MEQLPAHNRQGDTWHQCPKRAGKETENKTGWLALCLTVTALESPQATLDVSVLQKQAPQSPPDGDCSTVCSWAHGPSLGVRMPVPRKLLDVGSESPLSSHVANSAKCLISRSNFSSNAPSSWSGFPSYQAGNCGPNLRCSLGSHRDPQG